MLSCKKSPPTNKKDAHQNDDLLSVCWDITSRCNETCGFCYRFLTANELSHSKHESILYKLISFGVKKISFVGGEPLILKHLPHLLQTAKNAGVITSLVTNGILLGNRWKEIKNHLDWITLPIDGSKDTIQKNMGRMPGQVTNIQKFMNELRDNGVKIKFNSVIASQNHHDTKELIKIVNSQSPDVWKIFRFYPIRGTAKKNKRIYNIDQVRFNEITEEAENAFSKTQIKIVIADWTYLENNYFSISPNGFVRLSKNMNDIIIGDLSRLNIEQIWSNNLFNRRCHYQNHKWLI